MNPLKFITAETARAQIAREQKNLPYSVRMVEQIADWRMRIRLWNIVHQRYVFALRQNDSPTARHLFGVLKETRLAVMK